MLRSIVAHSHDYAAASDCGLYLTREVLELRDVHFEVESDRRSMPWMWKLIFVDELDRIKGEIDIEFTNQVCRLARAFITGRGGLAMPRER